MEIELKDVKEVLETMVKVKDVLDILNGCTVDQTIRIIAIVIDTLGQATNSNVFDWYNDLLGLTKNVHDIVRKDQE